MTKEGYKPVLLTLEAYDLAAKQAKTDQQSISKVASEAVKTYVYGSLVYEQKIRIATRVIEAESPLTSVSPTRRS